MRRDRDTQRRLRGIDWPRNFRVVSDLLSDRERELRAPAPWQRVPTRPDQAHHAIGDEQKSTELKQPLADRIIRHSMLLRERGELSNASFAMKLARRAVVSHARCRMADAPAEIEIIVRDAPTPDERATIIGGLVAYNEAQSMPSQHRELAVIARGGDAIIGGLFGFTSWNWLFIRHLWIAEAARGRGTGTRLIAAAEAAAVERGCAHAHCDTFEFQALPFYQKLGYEVFGQLVDYPPGFTRYFLQKRDLLRGD